MKKKLLNDINDRKLWRAKIANILKGHAKEEDLEEKQQYKTQEYS